MIPILKKKEGSVSAPIESIKREPDDGAEYDALESCAEDLCTAVKSDNYKLAAAAIRAAFQLLDEEPHQEGEHL